MCLPSSLLGTAGLRTQWAGSQGEAPARQQDTLCGVPRAALGAFGGRGESRGLRGCSRAWALSALHYRVLGFIVADRIVLTSGTALRSALTWIKPLGVTLPSETAAVPGSSLELGPDTRVLCSQPSSADAPGAGPGPAPHWMNSCQNTWEMQFSLAQNSNHLTASSVSISALRSI